MRSRSDRLPERAVTTGRTRSQVRSVVVLAPNSRRNLGARNGCICIWRSSRAQKAVGRTIAHTTTKPTHTRARPQIRTRIPELPVTARTRNERSCSTVINVVCAHTHSHTVAHAGNEVLPPSDPMHVRGVCALFCPACERYMENRHGQRHTHTQQTRRGEAMRVRLCASAR